MCTVGLDNTRKWFPGSDCDTEREKLPTIRAKTAFEEEETLSRTRLVQVEQPGVEVEIRSRSHDRLSPKFWVMIRSPEPPLARPQLACVCYSSSSI